MLSSDGLYEITQELQVIKQINKIANINSLTTKLVNYAVNSGGKDNITLLTIQSDIDTDPKNKVIPPLIIREFDSDSGEVLVVKDEEPITNETISNELRVKSVAPRALVSDEKPVAEKAKAIEIILLLSIIIAILIITTFNL